MDHDKGTLSVLSLNCWGLFFVSKQRAFRLNAIGHALLTQTVDIVALQEVWMRTDYEQLKTILSEKLPYSCYFQSGTLGSGLALFSKFPIRSSTYLAFTLAGRPLKVLEGDYYVGKGCGSVCIEHPTLGAMDVYTTHLQACYGGKDEYEAQRITECWQIVNQVRSSIAQKRHVILAGDFNSIPSSLCYKLLTTTSVTDSWHACHQHEMEENKSLFEQNQLSLSKCIECFGITCDSPLNTWTKHYLKQQPHQKEIGDRLDYIFSTLVCKQSEVVLTGCIPETDMSFSDHFGVHSRFRLEEEAPIQKQDQQIPLIKEMIQVLKRDHARAVTRTHRLLTLFGTCVLTVLALLVSVWFVPKVASALLALVVCALSVVATIALIVGFVFGKREERSLAQYITDMTFHIY
ncbi:DNase I-like protein [Backusella circina FSU 941]|nr:DNase I-like protein [Backusella circina FSU 941]